MAQSFFPKEILLAIICTTLESRTASFRLSQKDKSLLHAVCEGEAKKSAIFSLPLHTQHVKGIYPLNIV